MQREHRPLLPAHAAVLLNSSSWAPVQAVFWSSLGGGGITWERSAA
jgi:hypothetical protein